MWIAPGTIPRSLSHLVSQHRMNHSHFTEENTETQGVGYIRRQSDFYLYFEYLLYIKKRKLVR